MDILKRVGTLAVIIGVAVAIIYVPYWIGLRISTDYMDIAGDIDMVICWMVGTVAIACLFGAFFAITMFLGSIYYIFERVHELIWG